MDEKQAKNLVEALIFSAEEPLSIESIRKILSNYGKFDLEKLIDGLENDYKSRGINLHSIEKKNYYFRTSEDLGVFLNIQTKKTRNLSQAAMETLAIISYHQPVTRAEIEKIRGKPVFRGTLDNLLELKWIKACRKKRNSWETSDLGNRYRVS